MAAGDEVERRISEREFCVLSRLYDDHAVRVQQPGCGGHVRWPRLGGRRHERDLGCVLKSLSQHLATSGLDVERGRSPTEPRREQAGVAPRRSLLGGAASQPGEVPPGDVGVFAEFDQVLERRIG